MILTIPVIRFNEPDINGVVYTKDTEFKMDLSRVKAQLSVQLNLKPSHIKRTELVTNEVGHYIEFEISDKSQAKRVRDRTQPRFQSTSSTSPLATKVTSSSE